VKDSFRIPVNVLPNVEFQPLNINNDDILTTFNMMLFVYCRCSVGEKTNSLK